MCFGILTLNLQYNLKYKSCKLPRIALPEPESVPVYSFLFVLRQPNHIISRFRENVPSCFEHSRPSALTYIINNAAPLSISARLSRVNSSIEFILNVYVVNCVLSAIHGIKYS